MKSLRATYPKVIWSKRLREYVLEKLSTQMTSDGKYLALEDSPASEVALSKLQKGFQSKFPQKQWELCERDRLQDMVFKIKEKERKMEREGSISKKSEKDAVSIEEDAASNEVEAASNVEDALKMQKDKLQLATLLLQSVNSKFCASLEIPDGSMAAEMETSLNSLLDMKSSMSPLLSVKDDDLCNEACQVHSSLLSLASEIARTYNDFEWSKNYLHSVYILRREEDVVPAPESKKLPASFTKQGVSSSSSMPNQIDIESS